MPAIPANCAPGMSSFQSISMSSEVDQQRILRAPQCCLVAAVNVLPKDVAA